MQKLFRTGPIALNTTLTTNLLNANVVTTSGTIGITLTQPQLYIRHIRLINTGSLSSNVSMFLGGSGQSTAGTEFVGSALSVAGNSTYDWWGGPVRMANTDYVTGGASSGGITVIIEGEVGYS